MSRRGNIDERRLSHDWSVCGFECLKYSFFFYHNENRQILIAVVNCTWQDVFLSGRNIGIA